MKRFFRQLTCSFLVVSLLVPNWGFRYSSQSSAYANSDKLSGVLSGPGKPNETQPRVSTPIDELDKQVIALQEKGTHLLLRVRNPGTKTADLYGGKVGPTDIAAFEEEIQLHLKLIQGALIAPIARLAGTDSGSIHQFEQETLSRLNLIAHAFHALMSYAQIRAYNGAPLDPHRPQFPDGSPLAVRVSEASFTQVLGFSPLYENAVFTNPSMALSPRAYYADQLGTATSVVEYQLIPGQDGNSSGDLLIRPKASLLGQMASLAQVNRPTEMGYMQWVRDLVLIALTESLVDHSFLLSGANGLKAAQVKINSILEQAKISEHLKSQIISLSHDRLTNLQIELTRSAKFERILKSISSLEEIKVPSELNDLKAQDAAGMQWITVMDQWKRALSVGGTEQAITGLALQTYFMQTAETWFTDFACAGLSEELRETKSRSLHRALLKLDWQKILGMTPEQMHTPSGSVGLNAAEIEAERQKQRSAFDVQYASMARDHYPLWRASQEPKYLGLVKPDPIPDTFLDAPVIPAILRTTLYTQINRLGISSAAATRTFDSQAVRNATDASGYPAAKEAFLKGLQEIDSASGKIVPSALADNERKQLSNDQWALLQVGSLFGFTSGPLESLIRNTQVTPPLQSRVRMNEVKSQQPVANASVYVSPGPSLRSLPLTEENRRAYVREYLNFHWNTHTLLSPLTTEGSIGNLLEKLARSQSVSEFHNLLDPALEAKIDAAISSFQKIAEAKKPEDLANLLTTSGYVNEVLQVQIPGMKRIVNAWGTRMERQAEHTGWNQLRAAYSQPVWGFLGLIATEFMFRTAFRPVSWGLGRLGFTRAAAVTGLQSPLLRSVTNAQSAVNPYFRAYFTAYLGIMAVDIAHNFSNWRDLVADEEDARLLTLAQSGGKAIYSTGQLKIRNDATTAARNQFLFWDVAFNAGLFLVGPLTQKVEDLILASRERAMLKDWTKLGVRPKDFYSSKNIWDDATINKLADDKIASFEGLYQMQLRESGYSGPLTKTQLEEMAEKALVNRIEVEAARDSLLQIKARDTKNYSIALQSFQGNFAQLGMNKPSFKDTDIEAAFARQMRQIQSEEGALSGRSPLERAKLQIRSSQVLNAHEELRRFAASYVRYFPVGPFSRILYRGKLRAEELARAKKFEGSNLPTPVDTTVSYGLSADDATQYSKAIADIASGKNSSKLDALNYTLSKSYEARGQSVFGFWEAGELDRTKVQLGFRLWQFKDRDIWANAAKHSKELNYYSVLGVSPLAEQAELDAAYGLLTDRAAAGKVVQAGTAKVANLEQVHEAYVTLSQPRLRAEFDAFLIKNDVRSDFTLSRAEWIPAKTVSQPFKPGSKSIGKPLVEKQSVTVGTLPESGDAFFVQYSDVNAMPNLYEIMGVDSTASTMTMKRSLVRLRQDVARIQEELDALSPELTRKTIGRKLQKVPSDPGQIEKTRQALASAKAKLAQATQAYVLILDSAFKAHYDIALAEKSELITGERH